MTRRLEEIFDLPSSEIMDLSEEELRNSLKELDMFDKEIDSLTDLTKSDAEMDELAARSLATFTDLIDFGMNVDARAAAPILEAASKMMGHAIVAKASKIDKKLKLMDIKIKQKRLEHQIKTSKTDENNSEIEGSGRILDRNDLLKIMQGKND